MPCFQGRGARMETFFVKRQIVIGAILAGCLEIGLVLVRALSH